MTPPTCNEASEENLMQSFPSDLDKTSSVSGLVEKKPGIISLTKPMGILVVVSLIFVVVSLIYGNSPVEQYKGFAEAKVIDTNHQKSSENDSLKDKLSGGLLAAGINDTSHQNSSEDDLLKDTLFGGLSTAGIDETDHQKSSEDDLLKDKLFGGLLTAGIDENSCLSRYQSVLYRRSSRHKPSSYLQSRLRRYENLHKRCGPYTESYNTSVGKLKSGHRIGTRTNDCKYVVWVSYSGLGNRMLSLASAFLYALLTNRVLLVDHGKQGMDDLFCEPFPEKTWLLPPDFPLNRKLKNIQQTSPQTYGNILKGNVINNTMDSLPLPPFLYLYLAHNYGHHDKLFFRDQEQSVLQKVPWLIIKTNTYFIPSLFTMSSFELELSKLFPSKDKVFHHLGRYLFHPSNAVWGLITRYYGAYLANADERVGIQIRVFNTKRPKPFQLVYDQIVACSLKENLLPEVNYQEPVLALSGDRKSKAVLVTSLKSVYFDMLRNMYWENPTVTGEVIKLYQPSHEELQQNENITHNRKAWAEIYLLSLMDVLITSSKSTFGYVAQGLGGLKPWILYRPGTDAAPDPPCLRALSMEPCFHAPPNYDREAKTTTDTDALAPHLRHCEDVSWGLKLVEPKGL